MNTRSDHSAEVEQRLNSLEIFRSYKKSQYLSTKHASYFFAYEELLAGFRHTKFTFVEIGVLNGGSLFMWRDYFGPEARIIGIDFNPAAKQWEKEGFEIWVGNQADLSFWKTFFSTVGDIDVLLDDGGHTNEQQIVTVQGCLRHVRDGGLIIVEDTHTSYFKAFGNPSKFSFINYSKKLIDAVNSRFPAVHSWNSSLNQAIYSLSFYESIVCLRVDRQNCFTNFPTSNDGVSFDAEDFRHHDSAASSVKVYLRGKFSHLKGNRLLEAVARRVFALIFAVRSKLQSRSLRKYFQ